MAPVLHAPSVRSLRRGLHLLETEVEDFDVRAVVVVGAERALVFDTLAHPRQMDGVAPLVAGRPVVVVYSHADWDHAWGTGGLGGVVQVVAHQAAGERFRTDVPEELARRVAADPELWRDVVLVPPDRTFEQRVDLDLGGVTVELHALAGHTPDCLVGWIPEWRILLAGDTVETPLPVVNEGRAVPEWVDALSVWAGDGAVDRVVPSHGPVGGPELIADTVLYLQTLSMEIGPPEPPGLTPFYRDTHRRNLALMSPERDAPVSERDGPGADEPASGGA